MYINQQRLSQFKLLGKCIQPHQQENKEQVKVVIQPIYINLQPSPFCNENWNYETKGNDWNCKCSEGYEQSPLPINSYQAHQDPLNHATFDFQWNSINIDELKLVYEDNMLKMKCLDNACVFGTLIDNQMQSFQANEIRVHTPSDHTLDGKQYAMEIQVVFRADGGDLKKAAALSFLVDDVPGKRNYFLDQMDPIYLPNEKLKEVDLRGAINKDKAFISVEDLFKEFADDIYPQYFDFYHYYGSLTSPPCEEYTQWFIHANPIGFGSAGIQMIQGVLDPVQTSENCHEPKMISKQRQSNRGLQSCNGRSVQFYDASQNGCTPIVPQKQKEPIGHYEKITTKETKYFFVSDDKPSGIPGAFVVSESEATQGQMHFKQISTDQKHQGHFEKIKIKQSKYFYVPSNKPSGVLGAFVVSKDEVEQNINN